MNDEKKFRISTVFIIILVLFILSYNAFQEHFTTEIGSYIKRRIYYEKVLSKKGLPLHKGKYWKKLEE
jgi:hypothetical protein